MFTPHQVSHVRCQVSGVRCHVSGVTRIFFNYISIFFLQFVWASRLRVCYQRGLPHLVSTYTQVLPVLSPTILQLTFKFTKKMYTLQWQVNLRQTPYFQSFILPKGGQNLRGKYPCVRDKIHVWSWLFQKLRQYQDPKVPSCAPTFL